MILPSKYDVSAGHVFACFLTTRKTSKTGKIRPFWHSGARFSGFWEDFGASRFSAIFDRFLAGGKSAKNFKKARKMAKCGKLWVIFGRVGGRGGGRRKPFGRGVTTAANRGLSDTPRSPQAGGGGFKGYRLCRRPLLNQVLVILT